MAALNLRRTFRYPDSESENETREELDEEEQEAVIQKLLRQDEERNTQYTLIFTTIPLVSTLLYLPSFISSSSTASRRFLCLLSIASLFSTAYIMRYLRIERTDRKGKRPLRDIEAEQGPLIVRQYLSPANTFICAVLSVTAYVLQSQPYAEDMFWIFCLVPGIVFLLVWVSRNIMLSVDIKELEGLRYEYKGA
ncbi:hypothetical protein PAAG_07486 [Paracoccidioides lutzii Pb01]|uniref:Uncharacterized protein n=1 Tax=Paracoccidioides lutzii (strain ATCC MYA-826 / Pb01) TaxID=502779 RepID=C1H9P5_PARBA|nr:hypothetical protein PAAG_07486 [Paracoccidioides lutzii Pb01]EEH37068.2 hypothetical protein PAAG_07486 [Paracoccidioides lutzii Pb01]